mgnify:CR=1 FL=1
MFNVLVNSKVFKIMFIALIAIFLVSKASSEVPYDLRVHQSSLSDGLLTSYISLTDNKGDLIIELKQQDITVSYGENLGEIESFNFYDQSKEGIGFIFLVDISKSITKENFDLVKSSIITWINSMSSLDKVSLISFGEEVNILQDFSDNKELLISSIEKLERTDLETRLNDALMTSQEIASIKRDDLPRRKAIICLTDGLDEYIGGVTREELLNSFQDRRTAIYSIGFTEIQNEEELEGINNIAVLSRLSGGVFIDANEASIEGAYNIARERVTNTFVINSSCSSCIYDGKKINFNVSVALDGYELNTQSPITLIPFQEELSKNQKSYTYLWPLTAVILLLTGIYLYSRNKRKVDAGAFEDGLGGSFEEDSLEDTTLPVEDSVSINKKEVKLAPISSGVNEVLLQIGISPVVLGRSSNADVTISGEKEISGKHCEVSIEQERLFVSDLDSKNGTSVNGVMISTRHPLDPQDILGIGRIEFRVIYDVETKSS